MLDKNFPLEVTIERHESTSFDDGSDGFVIYLKVQNKTSVTQKINVLKANYITITGEQIEQDYWLNGYLKDVDLLMPNAFKQAGLIFYKPKLKQIEQNDVIYLTIELIKEGGEQTFCFQYKENNWLLTNSVINTIDLKLTPKQIERYLLSRIERFEAFEERFGITFQNISVVKSHVLHIYLELHSLSGTTIPHENVNESFNLECIFYDIGGKIIFKSSTMIFPSSFFGFKLIEFYASDTFNFKEEQISKIRIYPMK
jgi:hypothetical protein